MVFYGIPTFSVTGFVTVAFVEAFALISFGAGCFVEAFALISFGAGCVATVVASPGFRSRTERRGAGSANESSPGGDFLFAMINQFHDVAFPNPRREGIT